MPTETFSNKTPEQEKQDSLAKEWAQYLSTKPLGVAFSGDPTKSTPELITALQNLQSEIQMQKGKMIPLVSGYEIIQTPQAVKSVVKVPVQQPKPQQQLPQPQTITTKDQMTLRWKKYLNQRGLYSGDVTSSEMDAAFKQAMLVVEAELSEIVPPTKGMVWQGNQVNPAVSPQEFEAAMVLAKKYQVKKSENESSLLKKAQATLDALGPPDEYDQKPSATKPGLSREDTDTTYHPLESNHQGVMVNKIPKKDEKPEKKPQKPVAPKMKLDDRMLKLIDLMNKSEKN